MKKQVSKTVFKSKALKLLRQVEVSGEPIVVTDHGIPTVEIRRYQPNDNAPLDVLRGSVVSYDGPTLPVGVDSWEALK